MNTEQTQPPAELGAAPCSALLRVEATHFVAASSWEKRLGKWVCTKAAPIMRWHLTATPETVKQWLNNKGYTYRWLKPNVDSSNGEQ